MKTITENPVERRKSGKGFVAFICTNIYKILSLPVDFLATGQESERRTSCLEVDRDGQFAAYVNNRMNILLMWIQHIKKRDLASAKQHLSYFLHDMEHHFVDPYVDRDVRDAFRWMRTYVKVYPEVTKKDRTGRAYEMIERIYNGLGIKYPLRKNAAYGLN